MRGIISAVLFGVALAGCMSQQEQAMRLAANDDAVCQSYGLTYGTPQYADCRMRVAEQRNAQQAATDAQLLALAGAMNANRAPATLPPPPIQTNCQQLGNTVNCTTH